MSAGAAIDVLMATYRPDPERLQAQVESIRAQREVTVNLLQREDAAGEGPCANFAALLQQSTADYVAFSDQDDVWQPDKLSRELALLQKLEATYGRDTPLLVFSDETVVDAELRVLNPSLFRRSHLNPTRNLPRQLAFQNTANGNTMLFNAALRRKAAPIPAAAFMHDHWMTLVASSFGHISCLAEPTVLYRQTGGNVLGGAKVDGRYFLNKALDGRRALRVRIDAYLRQAAAFADRFGDETPAALRALAGLRSRSYPVRVLTLIRHGIFKNGLLRNLGLWAVI